MKKVLVLSNNDVGLYNFRKELLIELIKSNDVYISLPYGKRVDDLVRIGCKFIETNMERNGTNPLKELLLFVKYIKILNLINPHIVLTYTIKPNIYGSLACRIKKIPYINNITGLGATFQKDNLLQKVILFMQKIALKRSKCVFFQNKANFEYFKEKKVVINAAMIPGSGVNLKFHKLEEYPQKDIGVKFISISRIRKDKGFDELFEVAKYFKKLNKKVEFHIIGWYDEDKYKLIIENLARESVIIFHGMKEQEEVHDLIKDCHCLINASHHEGMSNVILEASACGRPIIASNIDGCKEAIDNGITGYTFKCMDTEDLKDKINCFIELEYENKKVMGEKARQKIEKEFDRTIVINAYLKAIENIIV